MKDVEGKVAFITGGSSGIGLGIARAFVDAGMKVVIGYRSSAHLDEAMHYLESAQEPRQRQIHAIQVDVTDRPGMEKAAAETVATFGKVHILVNNAGVSVFKPLSTTSYEEWDWLMNVNLNGVFNGVHTFLPHIKAHGEGGHIVTTSSIMGVFNVGGGQGAYSASKFADVGLMEALHAELQGTNIHASVFCPGVVGTNFMGSGRDRTADSPPIQSWKDYPAAIDPLEAGQHVLRGMRDNALYIFSHPEFAPVIQLRNEALMASIPAQGHTTEARETLVRSMLEKSIYVAEHGS